MQLHMKLSLYALEALSTVNKKHIVKYHYIQIGNSIIAH